MFVRPFWPCVPLLGVFSGCHSGPRAFLGFSWNLRGLSSLTPSEALFWTRGGKGVLVVSLCCFCFPLLLCFAAFSHQLEGADPSSYEAYPRVVEPAPRPSEGPGSAVVRARLDTGLQFLGFFFASLCLAEGHRDPRDHFWRGGGAYCLLRSEKISSGRTFEKHGLSLRKNALQKNAQHFPLNSTQNTLDQPPHVPTRVPHRNPTIKN